MKTIALFRKNISNKSGTGQLIVMQMNKLKAANHDFQLYCKKGFFRTWLMARLWPQKAKVNNHRLQVARPDCTVIVDHDSSLRNADFTFIHNLITSDPTAPNEYLTWLQNSQCHIIANSAFTKHKLQQQAIAPQRISVVHPGYNHLKFNRDNKARFRLPARKALGIAADKKVIGFITSGDFKKRGLVDFLDICLNIHQQDAAVEFFVLGSHSFPAELADHPVVKLPQFHYKPKNARPEYWLSVLDIFVYPAKLEEFGMVIPEALAMDIPVITTANVGATEILPAEYRPWIHPQVDVAWFSERTASLLRDHSAYQLLVAASRIAIGYNNDDYATRTLATIQHQIEQRQ